MFSPPFVWLQKRPAVPELEFSGEIAGGELAGAGFSDSELSREERALGLEMALSQTLRFPRRQGILPKPESLSHTEAAALPIATILPYWSLVSAGGLKMGGNQRVFIIAAAFGAHVVSTCSPTSLELVTSLGANETIDYRTVSVPEHLSNDFSGEKAFDVIFDCVGTNELYTACPTFLKPDGLYAVIGAPAGGFGQFFRFGKQMATNLALPGWLGGTPRRWEFIQVPSDKWGATFESCLELIKQGKVKPVIDQVHTIEEAMKGYERVLSGRYVPHVILFERDLALIWLTTGRKER
ncbi:hypothetical protein P7C70_g5465, partial [Phenoliferia sp. Uapishka_3]